MFRRKEPVLKFWTRDVVLATGRVARCTWHNYPGGIEDRDIEVPTGWVDLPGWITEGEYEELRLAFEGDPFVRRVMRDPGKPAGRPVHGNAT
jgi:hypothetical protein